MDDRFKFRVWDIGNDKFCFFNLEQGLSDRIEQMTNYKGIGSVEQCTGLKDKNGKLIFESDLVKCVYNNSRIEIGTVVWQSGCGVCGFEINTKENLRLDFLGCEIEVIGNIHQNSELLEKGGK